jgi:trk system potassium uptake protein TrkH
VGLLATREKILLFVYQNKEKVLRTLSWLRTMASLLALAIFLYYYGFPHPPERLHLLVGITKSIFGFFVLSYIIRVIFAIHSWQYIRNSLFEAALILLLMFDIISVFFFGFNALENLFLRLNIENFTPFYILFIQSYLLLLVGLEVTKVSTSIPSIKLKPATTFIYSFLLLLLLGTGLLMLPEMTTAKGSMPFIDAFFTAVSAACVTGLAVVDTATYFTFKGHLVILLLFQLGGIGILTFATFFALFLKKGVGISHQAMIRDFMSEDSLFNAKGMLQQIVFFTLLIEAIGAVLIYMLWDVNTPFYDDPGEMIFQSVFHSISAFCNAGFSLMSNGLSEDYLQNAYILHIVIGVLIIFGSLGFPAMRDIFGIKNIRARIAAPWKRWKLSTRIAVWATLALIIFGMGVFYLLEKDSSQLEGKNTFQQVVIAFFQSVTTRSSGYNTIDIGLLSTPTAILFIFLMFIGGSSGSTGGGIKTSTFVLIFLSVITTIRGKKSLELGGRSISFDLLNKAFTIFIFSATYILVGTFFLAIFEPKIAIIDLVFEQVSAFCTVGLSRGITPDLSTASKIVLVISMYIGRVGTLTLAFALASRVDSTNYRYPKAHILVG